MAPLKRQRSERSSRSSITTPCMNIGLRLLSMCIMIFGPLLLLYLTLRCEKNQCVLFQLPLVLPTHLSAFFSTAAMLVVLGFIALMFLLSFTSMPVLPKAQKDAPALSTGFSSLICTSLLLITLAYLKPEYIQAVHGEYLRMLTTMIVFCIMLSGIIFMLGHTNMVMKERDLCYPMAFFYGNYSELRLGHVELKYFFYVHVGMVAWALLDLLILLNVAVERTVTAPLAFLTVSQYMVIGHTLLYENFLRHRPFIVTEGLGFFWLMRVLLFLPFFHSLPVYYAAATEFTLPKPAILADCVFFLFGFVIYISSIHQRENFLADPSAFKNLKSITSPQGKRLLISGYWGIVQKPDYLGLMIIWLSWTIACGFSGLAIVVLIVIYTTIFLWLRQTAHFKQVQYGNAWSRYTNQVPKQIIPLVF